MKKVLITGSSGLIGGALKKELPQGNSQIVINELSRRKSDSDHIFQWNIEKQELDIDAIAGVDTIIHLAGAGIADEKWTPERKKVLLESRTLSTRLLYNTLKDNPNQVKTIICASAIGFYGFDRGTELVDEESEPGKDFLAGITVEWEKEAGNFRDLGIRVVSLRIGIVLSTQGGALAEIMKPVKWMAGAALGNGKQYMSWIHIEDMAKMIHWAAKNKELNGIYNAVAPEPETNKEFTRKLARVMKKPFFLPPVPAFILKAMVGEMSVLVLGGLKVSSRKISETGYAFQYSDLTSALEDLINNN